MFSLFLSEFAVDTRALVLGLSRSVPFFVFENTSLKRQMSSQSWANERQPKLQIECYWIMIKLGFFFFCNWKNKLNIVFVAIWRLGVVWIVSSWRVPGPNWPNRMQALSGRPFLRLYKDGDVFSVFTRDIPGTFYFNWNRCLVHHHFNK